MITITLLPLKVLWKQLSLLFKFSQNYIQQAPPLMALLVNSIAITLIITFTLSYPSPFHFLSTLNTKHSLNVNLLMFLKPKYATNFNAL